MINRIFLHWTAGRYDQLFRDYHICIDGEGREHIMGPLEERKAHTYMHNSNAIGIALCCCYGASVRVATSSTASGPPSPQGEGQQVCIDWGDYPPTDQQIFAMGMCVARLCKIYGLPIEKDTVMTHAEIAEIDGYGVHSHDPDMRWDLLRLPGWGSEMESGGSMIRWIARDLIDRGEV